MKKSSTKLDIPECDFQNEEIILGIDEAGRGPVLGPMVYACCYFPKHLEKELKAQFKFDDSKIVKEEDREKIYEKMCNNKHILDFQAIVIDPQEMSNKQLKRSKISLNVISTDAAVQLIRDTLNKGVNVKEVYVDTVGPPQLYQDMLYRKFPNFGIEFTVSAKADSLFPSVSAASIVAKVTRDREVKNWRFKENIENPDGDLIFNNNFGCGYPGDVHTKQWLKDNIDQVFGFPSFVRFSWKTTKTLMDDSAKKIKWENYDDEIEDSNNIQPYKIMDCFNKNKKKFNYLEENQIKFTNFKI